MLNRSRLLYLSKILAGLMVLSLTGLAAILLPDLLLSDAMHLLLTTALCLLFIGFVYVAWRRWQSCDELRRLINAQACVAALATLAGVSGIVGVLQLQGYLLMFNQLWTFLLALAIWALSLMLADRPFQLEIKE